MADPDMVRRLDAVPRRPLAVASYRHVSAGRHPLSGEGARIQGGRWNPRESFPTLYLALAQDVAVREFHRLAARTGRSPDDFLPREVYRIEVTLHVVLDLTEPQTVKAVGVNAEQLSREDLTTCQAVGDAAHYTGFEAVLAPSAAGPGAALAVYADRLSPSSILVPHAIGTWDVPPAR